VALCRPAARRARAARAARAARRAPRGAAATLRAGGGRAGREACGGAPESSSRRHLFAHFVIVCVRSRAGARQVALGDKAKPAERVTVFVTTEQGAKYALGSLTQVRQATRSSGAFRRGGCCPCPARVG
jgi:hypothetical protein